MQVQVTVIYPAIKRELLKNSEAERRFPVTLNIGCAAWEINTAMRKGFCDLLFAGCGNHPGLNDLVYRYPNHDGIHVEPKFDSGDKGINNVHRQWAVMRTRSMSVGDLITIDPVGLNESWVCDSIGWLLLTPEQAESWLAYPRQCGCDSSELQEWLKQFETKL